MTKPISMLTVLVLLSCGCGDDGVNPTTNGDAGPDSGTGTDTDTGTSTDYDCAALPQGPFEMMESEGVASKDIAFDDEGHLVGSNYTQLYKTTIDGEKDEIADNIASCTGIRYLPNDPLYPFRYQWDGDFIGNPAHVDHQSRDYETLKSGN